MVFELEQLSDINNVINLIRWIMNKKSQKKQSNLNIKFVPSALLIKNQFRTVDEQLLFWHQNG